MTAEGRPGEGKLMHEESVSLCEKWDSRVVGWAWHSRPRLRELLVAGIWSELEEGQ